MQIEHSDFQDHLVRGLTHRMNNILTLFHGYLGLLLDDKKLDKPTLDGLARIKEGARAASELMDRTQSLARPSTLVWRELDLSELVRRMKPSFDVLCGPQTRVEFDLADDLPPVWVDTARLKTAIFEVVRNAIEATFAGGIVTVSLHPAPLPPGVPPATPLPRVLLTVTDNGPGIPAETGEKVFQPFFSTKKKQNATGLGLTVALGFVQQIGGVLRFTSEPGKTEFHIVLPSRGQA